MDPFSSSLPTPMGNQGSSSLGMNLDSPWCRSSLSSPNNQRSRRKTAAHGGNKTLLKVARLPFSSSNGSSCDIDAGGIVNCRQKGASTANFDCSFSSMLDDENHDSARNVIRNSSTSTSAITTDEEVAVSQQEYNNMDDLQSGVNINTKKEVKSEVKSETKSSLTFGK